MWGGGRDKAGMGMLTPVSERTMKAHEGAQLTQQGPETLRLGRNAVSRCLGLTESSPKSLPDLWGTAKVPPSDNPQLVHLLRGW